MSVKCFPFTHYVTCRKSYFAEGWEDEGGDSCRKETINDNITAPVTAKGSRLRVKGLSFLNPVFTENHNNILYKINLILGIGWHLCSNHSVLWFISSISHCWWGGSNIHQHFTHTITFWPALVCVCVCARTSSGRPRWMDVSGRHRIVCSHLSLPNRSPPCCMLQTGAQL